MKTVLRAITKEPLRRDRSVVKFSVKSVGEIVLGRVVGEAGERQNNDGQMLGLGGGRWVRSNRRGRCCLDKVGR